MKWDVFSCVNEAEILARKEGGCIVRTADAALCLPSSTGSGDISGASEGGDACLSGSSILSGVLAATGHIFLCILYQKPGRKVSCLRTVYHEAMVRGIFPP